MICLRLSDLSCDKSRGKHQCRAGSGGVTLVVHESLTMHNAVDVINTNNPAATAHCKAIRLQPPGSERINIWGLYMPWDDLHNREQLHLMQIHVQNEAEQAAKDGAQPAHIHPSG